MKSEIVTLPSSADGYRCPCCGYRTLKEGGGFEICQVFSWEDYGQDDQDAEVIRGGPNALVSLTQARRNFARCGASSEAAVRFVRPPRDDER